MKENWLRWATPILAALTALMEAGHEGNLFSSEVLVLILAILTAVSAFTAAITARDDHDEQKAQTPTKPTATK